MIYKANLCDKTLENWPKAVLTRGQPALTAFSDALNPLSHSMAYMVSRLFTTQSRLLTTPKKQPLKNTEGKGENAGNQHFLLLPQCFLLNLSEKLSFYQCLSSKMLSIWSCPKFGHLITLIRIFFFLPQQLLSVSKCSYERQHSKNRLFCWQIFNQTQKSSVHWELLFSQRRLFHLCIHVTITKSLFS